MTSPRHVLVIATQCRSMPALTRLHAAGESLRDLMLDPEHGGCSPGLPDGRALLTGELKQDEIQAAVRDAVEHAAAEAATLVLAFMGHGFVPGEQPTLHLMAADSQEDVANTAVNVSTLLSNAADRAEVAGVIALVDTCNAAGAMPAGPAIAAGARRGRIKLDVMMASTVGQAASDFKMTTTLVKLMRSGIDDTETIDLAAAMTFLQKHVKPPLPVHHRYDGAPGDLWLSRNRRVSDPTMTLGSLGYSQYRDLVRHAFPELTDSPPLAEVVRKLAEKADPWMLARAQDLMTVKRTVALLRGAALHEAVTAKSLRRAARTMLPAALFAEGTAIDAEVVAHLVLSPPVGQNGREEILRFVLTLACDVGCDLRHEALDKWCEDLGLLVQANEIRQELVARQAASRLRLIVSLHSSRLGDWPEQISAWLVDDDEDEDIDHTQFDCSPDMPGVTSAIFTAVDKAQDLADQRGLTLRRVEVAAPAALLLHWHPEEIESGTRLGWDYDVVVHWSDRLKQPRRLTRSMRQRLATEHDPATPFSWLEATECGDIARLDERLRNRTLRTAVVLGSRPADAESVLATVLSHTPFVIWPTRAGHNEDPREALLAVWNMLPAGFITAYRSRWRDPSIQDAVAGLRAVWDDDSWLSFCVRMQWRSDREDAA